MNNEQEYKISVLEKSIPKPEYFFYINSAILLYKISQVL